MFECVCKCVGMCTPTVAPEVLPVATSPGQLCVSAGCGPGCGSGPHREKPGRRQVLETIWIWALGGQGLLPEPL